MLVSLIKLLTCYLIRLYLLKIQIHYRRLYKGFSENIQIYIDTSWNIFISFRTAILKISERQLLL